MYDGVKKDIWSVMKDFFKVLGVKDLSKIKTQYVMFVGVVVDTDPVGDTVIHNPSWYT